MKRIVLAVVASLAVGAMGFGQTQAPAPAAAPARAKGPRAPMALVFSIGNFMSESLDGFMIPTSGALGAINPESYDGFWIGGKYGFSETMFARALAMFSWVDGGATSFGILPGIQLYFTRKAPVDLYWGGELGFGMTFSDLPGGGDYRGLAFVPRAFIGAECFLKESLSLSAEYRIGYSYLSGHWEPSATPVENAHMAALSTGSFGLMLSFYF